jgi:tRNA threonylcarbamoyladenosine biosynthesis protein TsaB
MILAIETSASVCSVGFFSHGKLLSEYQSDAPMKHSEQVGNFIEQGLKENEGEIELVSVAIGPGSFTGLRIGLSYAQGFCFGRDIPIVGVSNHQILAKQGEKNKEIYTIIDAYRQELYLAKHIINDTMEIESHRIVKKNEIENELPEDCQLIFLENTLDTKLINNISKNISCIKAKFKTVLLAEIGHLMFLKDNGQNPEDLQPMYIRPFAGIQ